MPWRKKQFRARGVVETSLRGDDGGTGLLEAARQRFEPRGCEIFCDRRHTVWVKSADGRLSLGLPQWRVDRSSVDELLDGVEERLSHEFAHGGAR